LRSWFERLTEIAEVAKRQLFFVGGAPRSGTTWLQQMLDCHPDISCRGEGLFLQQLATPMERLIAERSGSIDAKNRQVFRHAGGYPLPAPDDSEFLTATAILLALHRQSEGRQCSAIGEKTPENVFFFPRLKSMFPGAKLICIARDPRDVLTSAWHFFHSAAAGEDEVAAKMEFVRGALAPLNDGARTMMALAERHPVDCVIVTYEALLREPEPVLARLFGFLGVSSSDTIVADCLARTAFSKMTAGRSAGVEQAGSFFRKGVAGGWSDTLTAEMSAIILQELGWMFPHFGWRI
jgi:LPS sulfotransferase NodH